VGSFHGLAGNHHFSEGTLKKLASTERLDDGSNALDSDDDGDADDDESEESKYNDDR